MITVLDEAKTRVELLKAGVPIKEIEKLWVEKHGYRVVYWNILRDKNDD